MDLVNCIRKRGGPGQGGEKRVLRLLVAEGDGGVHVFRAKERGGGSFTGTLSRGLSLIQNRIPESAGSTSGACGQESS